jgi:hypothetical protein
MPLITGINYAELDKVKAARIIVRQVDAPSYEVDAVSIKLTDTSLTIVFRNGASGLYGVAFFNMQYVVNYTMALANDPS